MSTDSSVVVLGGAGFVGRQVCAALAARGQEVVAMGRRPPEVDFGHRLVRLDLAERDVSEIAMTLRAIRPRAVVNTVGSIWGRSDDQMWDATATPTLRLLEALSLMPATPRLVHLGSVLEYGTVPVAAIGVAPTPQPGTAYGRGKRAATDAVLRRTGAGELPGMVLRIANVAGPGAPRISLLGQVAQQLANAIRDGGPAQIELYPMQAWRDYVDVRDVADAVVAAVGSPLNGRVVDIGRGEAVPVRALVDLLIEVSGVPATVHETAPSLHRPRRPGRDWIRVDPRPARELLGWEPVRPLVDSVEALWREVRAQVLSRTTDAAVEYAGTAAPVGVLR